MSEKGGAKRRFNKDQKEDRAGCEKKTKWRSRRRLNVRRRKLRGKGENTEREVRRRLTERREDD
jgi:hypothetical protein